MTNIMRIKLEQEIELLKLEIARLNQILATARIERETRQTELF